MSNDRDFMIIIMHLQQHGHDKPFNDLHAETLVFLIDYLVNLACGCLCAMYNYTYRNACALNNS